MRSRVLLAVCASAAVAMTVLPAHAGGAKVLDGKKAKTLTFKDVVSTPQDNDTNSVTDFVNLVASTPIDRPDIATCAPPRCSRFDFVVKPARGVKKGPISARIAWTIPGQDYDLYLVENGGDVGHCGASAGTSEVVRLETVDYGKKYTLVVDHYRALPDTVTATVSFPAKDTVGSTAPAAVDGILPINCGLG